MNNKVSILLAGLLACSMQSSAVPPTAAPTAQPRSAPPMVIRSMPVEPPAIRKDSKGLPPPRICQLGNDCLTMDSRPFEMCQVSGKRCGDKLAEVLQVERPKVAVKPAPLLPASR
jgi:hypothetical protein